MKKSKLARVAALCLAIAMTVIPVSCSSTGVGSSSPTDTPPGSSATGEVTVVRIMTQFGENTKHAGVEAISRAVEAKHPQWKFEATHLAYNNYVEKLKQEMAAGDPPTIFTGRAWEFPEFIDSGKVVALTDQPFMENYPDEVKKEGTRNGEVWTFPQDKQGAVVWYRKELFRDVLGTDAYPKTRSEFLEVCQKFKDAGITPIAFGGSEKDPCNYTLENWFFPEILAGDRQLNDKIMKGEAKASESPEYKAALKNVYEMLIPYIEKNDMSIPREKAYDMFFNLERPMTIHGNFVVGVFREAVPDGEFSCFPVPWSEKEAENNVNLGTDDDLMIAADGNVEAGLAWLEYAASVEGLNTWAEKSGAITASDRASEVTKMDPMAKDLNAFFQAGKTYYKGDMTILGSSYSGEFQAFEQSFINSAIDAYAAGTDADAFIDSQLAELDQRFQNLS